MSSTGDSFLGLAGWRCKLNCPKLASGYCDTGISPIEPPTFHTMNLLPAIGAFDGRHASPSKVDAFCERWELSAGVRLRTYGNAATLQSATSSGRL